jgi:hypothetical protein
VAAVVLGVFALTVTAPPASAQTACWKQIIDDWVNDGAIEGVYPLHCYGEAINHVPNDLAQYTGIIDDITAARQQAARGVRTTQAHNGQSKSEPTSNDPSGGVYNQAIDKLGPTNSDSLPLPLLILAGLALIMLATGAVGLASRHLKARKSAA